MIDGDLGVTAVNDGGCGGLVSWRFVKVTLNRDEGAEDLSGESGGRRFVWVDR